MDIRKQTMKWKIKDGTKIRICDMGDSHLLNAIAYLERKAEEFFEKADAQLAAMEGFLSGLRGEEARYAAEGMLESGIGKTPDDFLPPIYSKMREDARRRGLAIKESSHE